MHAERRHEVDRVGGIELGHAVGLAGDEGLALLGTGPFGTGPGQP
jgi:hypothetical protein